VNATQHADPRDGIPVINGRKLYMFISSESTSFILESVGLEHSAPFKAPL